MNWPLFLKQLQAKFRRSTYHRVGGQKVIDTLVEDFYQIMREDPLARECLLTHQGRDIGMAAQKLKLFLSGWLGGPQLYVEKYGHPRLRMRHMPFAIGDKEADQWIYCMKKALERSSIRPAVQTEMLTALTEVAIFMRNRG